jgi:hypothetical protein
MLILLLVLSCRDKKPWGTAINWLGKYGFVDGPFNLSKLPADALRS